MFIYLLMHAFGVIVFLIWFLYAWFAGSKFGSQPSCNDLVNFVLFFTSIRATVTWLRVIMIMLFIIATPFFFLMLCFLILAPVSWTTACTKALQRLFDKNPRLGLIRYVVGVPLAINIISNLELIIYRNRSIIQPGENEWGFGQIIAVVLTLGIFIDMVAAIRERYWQKHKTLENSENYLTR